MFANAPVVIDRVDSNPVLRAGSQSSNMEDGLIGTDIDNHVVAPRIEHLKKSWVISDFRYPISGLSLMNSLYKTASNGLKN